MITIKKLAFLVSCLNCLFICAPGQAEVNGSTEKALPDDWIAEPASVSLCQGHYEPFASGSTSIEDNDLPIELSADETQLTLSGQSLLSGNVTLRQGSRYLHTDEVIIERNQDAQDWERIIAQGNLHYAAPGISIWGTKAIYTHSPQHFRFEDTLYRWYPRHARGVAKAIEIDEDAVIKLHKANYTTCAPNKNTWLLSANNISLYPNKGRAKAQHIRLDMKGIPVFYFPYINYPIDNKRHSGFLFPSYGTSSSSGYELTIPFYWNIAPNYDFTFAGKWLSLRGVEGQSKFRYLFPQSEGAIQWHFLPDDRAYGNFQRENRLSPPGGLSFNDPRIIALEGNNNRSAFNFRHNTHWDRRWQLNVIFDYVSDDNYFVDLGNDISIASTIHLPQQANLAYYGEYWTHLFNVEEYQVLQPLAKDINEEIYKRQPQWVFQAIYPNQMLGFTFGLNGESVNFNHRPNLLTQTPVTTGQRYHLRPSLSLPIQEQAYFFTPRVQVDWLKYSLELSQESINQNLPKSPSRYIPLYDIDSGLFFERNIDFAFFSGVQTFEPRLYYLYVPFRDQHTYPDFDSGIMNFSYAQLFRDNRFSGRDRIGDANQISVSFMSRFLPSKGGQELLRASIGQIFYFRDRRVSLCEEFEQENACFLFDNVNATSRHSKLIAQTELHVTPTWSGGLFWEWDSSLQVSEQAALTLQYQPSPNKVFNMNYYWLKHDLAQLDFATGETGSLNQVDASFLWPVSLHWELLSLWRYDFEKHQTVEVIGGLEYSGCCLALQLIGSRYRMSNKFYYPKTYDTAVFAQIVFKGLSAIGLNNPDSRLKQKIPGYVPLSSRQRWLTSPQKPNFPPEEISIY
ncbi:MAG: LPS assembly protein LptD [Proteobacteria bacterium]|nr:LPS assembly protein LptD [Pseudomonadota bacterium]